MIVRAEPWSCLVLESPVRRGSLAEILQLEGQLGSADDMGDQSSICFVAARGSMPYI